MFSMGRSPCPCGSGLAFAVCCGRSVASAMPLGWAEVHRHWPRTHATLVKWTIDVWGAEAVSEALARFARPAELPMWDGDGWMPLAQSWLIYDWVPADDGRNVASRRLHEVASASALRAQPFVEIVRAANASPLSLYQVEAVEPGVGAEVRDLLLDRVHFIHDRSLSTSASVWSILAGRLITCMGVTILDAAAPMLLDALWRGRLLDAFEAMTAVAAPCDAEMLRACGTDVFGLFDDAVDADLEHRREPQRLANTDGDPMVLCRVEWDLDPGDAATIMQRLADLGWEGDGLDTIDDPDADVATDRTVSFMLVDANRTMLTGSDTVGIGTLRLRRGRMRLECNSRARRDRIAQGIDTELAAMVRRRSSREEDVSEIRRWTAERGWLDSADALRERFSTADEDDPFDDLPKGSAGAFEKMQPEERQALRDFVASKLREAERAWPDQSVPALGGITPREAMRTERGRRQLEDLLRSMERETPAPASEFSGGMSVDALRRELGMLPK